jgi:hypothetical protein
MDWFDLAQDKDRLRALVNAVMNLRVQYNAQNFLTIREPVSFSRRTLLHDVSQIFLKIFLTFDNRQQQINNNRCTVCHARFK